MKTLQEIEEKLKGSHFSPEGGRAVYFLYHYLIVASYEFEHPVWKLREYFIGAAALLKQNIAKWFFIIADADSFIAGLMLFVKETDRLSKLEKYITNLREETIAHISAHDIAKISNEQLGSMAQLYCDNFKLLIKAASTMRAIDRGVMSLITNRFPADQKDEILRIFSTNLRMSSIMEEEYALLKLAVAASNDASVNIDAQLQAVYEKYCFITMGYFNEPPRNVDYYKARFADIQKNNPQEMLQTFESKIQHDIKAREEFIKKFDAELQQVAHVAGEATYLKDYYKYSVNKLEYYAEEMFKEIARRSGVSIDDVKDCNPAELVAAASGRNVDFAAVRARREINLGLYLDEKIWFFDAEEARHLEKNYITKDFSTIKEFKGRVACKGYAKATAKVITSPKDFHKMQKGDVLVVINTSPDFVPIMHLASAIVSEEGGLTAHVSVVSREFGIPSIVGIRGIADVIKDGDTVEVDADKGIVRKI